MIGDIEIEVERDGETVRATLLADGEPIDASELADGDTWTPNLHRKRDVRAIAYMETPSVPGEYLRRADSAVLDGYEIDVGEGSVVILNDEEEMLFRSDYVTRRIIIAEAGDD